MYILDTVLCEPGEERSEITAYKQRYPAAAYGTVVSLPVKTPGPLDAQCAYELYFWRRRYPSVA